MAQEAENWILIQSVPTGVCTKCGEQVLRGQVVAKSEQIQRERFGQHNTLLNGRMNTRLLRKHCKLDDAGEQILKQALTELGLSARAHDKILRVSRTIADLHLSEAIMYRRLDRQL